MQQQEEEHDASLLAITQAHAHVTGAGAVAQSDGVRCARHTLRFWRDTDGVVLVTHVTAGESFHKSQVCGRTRLGHGVTAAVNGTPLGLIASFEQLFRLFAVGR